MARHTIYQKPWIDGKRVYYVYVLMDDAYRVFYVGKGTGARMSGHASKTYSDERVNQHCKNIRAMGGSVHGAKIFMTFDQGHALLVEDYYISFYEGPQLLNVAKYNTVACDLYPCPRSYIASTIFYGRVLSRFRRDYNARIDRARRLLDRWSHQYERSSRRYRQHTYRRRIKAA